MKAAWRALVSLFVLVAAVPSWAAEAPDTEATPERLERVGDEVVEAPPPLPRLSDPLGRRFVRRAIPGLVLIPAAPLLGLTGVFFAFSAPKSSWLFVALPLAAQGLAIGGGLGTTIALERAAIDLRLRGVPISTAAARFGDVLLGAGTATMVVAACFFDFEMHSGNLDLPILLAMAGGTITAVATIPYAIQTGIVSKAYRRLPPSTARRTFSITPTLDPVARTIGITGTF